MVKCSGEQLNITESRSLRNWPEEDFLERCDVRSFEPSNCLVSTVKDMTKDIFGLNDPYGPLQTSDILYSVIFKIVTIICHHFFWLLFPLLDQLFITKSLGETKVSGSLLSTMYCLMCFWLMLGNMKNIFPTNYSGTQVLKSSKQLNGASYCVLGS